MATQDKGLTNVQAALLKLTSSGIVNTVVASATAYSA